MPDKRHLIAGSLLGAVGQGLNSYGQARMDQDKMRQDYALKQLSDRPETQKTYEWLNALPPEEQPLAAETAYSLKSASNPYVQYDPSIIPGSFKPKKTVTTPSKITARPTTQQSIGAVRAYLDWERNGQQGSPPRRPTEQEMEIYRGTDSYTDDKFTYGQ